MAIVQLADRSHFVSGFTDPNEKVPEPPRVNPAVIPVPDIQYLALAPDATRLAVARTPAARQFTIDLLPAATGRLVSELKPERTLGPFPGPCRDLRYTPGGRLVTLHGSEKVKEGWSLAVIIGVYAGLKTTGFAQGDFVEQLAGSLVSFAGTPLQTVNALILTVGLIASLLFFFFSREHKGALGVASKLGIWFLMIGFGAGYGFTVMSRISLLIGRFQFLINDWAGIR